MCFRDHILHGKSSAQRADGQNPVCGNTKQSLSSRRIQFHGQGFPANRVRAPLACVVRVKQPSIAMLLDLLVRPRHYLTGRIRPLAARSAAAGDLPAAMIERKAVVETATASPRLPKPLPKLDERGHEELLLPRLASPPPRTALIEGGNEKAAQVSEDHLRN